MEEDQTSRVDTKVRQSQQQEVKARRIIALYWVHFIIGLMAEGSFYSGEVSSPQLVLERRPVQICVFLICSRCKLSVKKTVKRCVLSVPLIRIANTVQEMFLSVDY